VCHSRGLIHRDVKPANLFLRGDEHAQLGDFGVAEFLDASGQVPAAGDPRIQAPEMFAHGRGDVRSDIYSAGVTLYALVAGTYPFPAGSPVDAVIKGLAPKLRDVAPNAPQRLASRIAKAMTLDPADRYQSAREMAGALAEIPGSLRVWTRVEAHESHEKCWVSPAGRGQPGLQVCVTEAGGRYSIETRRANGGRSRVRACCRAKVQRRKLAVELRRVFDQL
jgi:serine/threonine-protein kinase